MAGLGKQLTEMGMVRCDDCGATINEIAWTPGMRCPRCSSENYSPIPVVGGESDYSAANRSAGYALEDIRFARLAQWAGLLTPKQVQQALHDQRAVALSGKKAPDLGALFVEHKMLTRDQVQGVLAARRNMPGNKDDADFGSAAVKSNVMTHEQLEECTKIQDDMFRQGRDPAPLPLIVYEKRYMKENQILALLMSAMRQQKGLLSKIRNFVKPEGYSIVDKLLGPEDSPSRPLRASAVILGPVVIIIAVVFFFSGIGTRVTTQCQDCGAVGAALLSSKWPIECLECHKKAVWPMAICLKCGNKYARISTSYNSGCPVCGSNDYKMLTRSVNEKEILANIKANKDKAKSQ